MLPKALLKARCDESEDSEDLVAQLRSALEQWHPPQMCTAPTKLLQFQLNQAQRVVTAGPPIPRAAMSNLHPLAFTCIHPIHPHTP